LSPAELGHIAFAHAGELHQRERLLDARRELGPGHFARAQSECHIFKDAHMREQGVTLKHHGRVAFFGGEVRDVASVKRDRAGIGCFETGGDAQRGRFAASARPQQGEELAFGDVAGEFADAAPLGKDPRDVLELYAAHRAP